MKQGKIGIWQALILLGFFILLSPIIGWLMIEYSQTKALHAYLSHTSAKSSPEVSPLKENKHREMLHEASRINADRASYLGQLLLLKEAEGKDNALIYYAEAEFLIPKWNDKISTTTDLLKEALTNGWSEKTEPLRHHFAIWQPVFKKIREGIAVDYSKGIGMPQRLDTQIANVEFFILCTKSLCAEGLLFESENRHQDALENYITVFSMSDDLMSSGNDLIGFLTGVAGESAASRQIMRLAMNEKLTAESLQEIQNMLNSSQDIMERLRKRALETQQTILADIPYYSNLFRVAYQLGNKHDFPEGMKEVVMLKGSKKLQDYFSAVKKERKMLARPETVESNLKSVYQFENKYLQAYWWEYSSSKFSADYDDLINRYALDSIHFTNVMEAKCRTLQLETKLRCCNVLLALLSYKEKQGRYPNKLDDLRSGYFPKGVPIDPFSGKSFNYERTKEGDKEAFRLSSMGPDMRKNEPEVVYDATNGSLSAGDIVVVP